MHLERTATEWIYKMMSIKTIKIGSMSAFRILIILFTPGN